jgi:hypothetical protein
MRRFLLLPLLLLGARAAFAVTCGGFSIVPADHVLVKYGAPVATDATRSTAQVSISGTDITVTRTLSGGSATNVSCVDETVDLGRLGAGRFDLTWSDIVNFTTQRSAFTFFVGAPAPALPGLNDDVAALPPLIPDHPVRLAVNDCSPSPAVAYRSGNDIRVSQYGSGLPCTLSVIDLGALPEATYDVALSAGSTEDVYYSSSFTFIVQQPAPASACHGTFSVTRNPNGMARLHFEDSYRGYTPSFGPPAVTEIADYPRSWPPFIKVVQTVTDSADSAVSGAAPPSTICHAEELDLGSLPDGNYTVGGYDQLSVNGSDLELRDSLFVSFLWRNGTVQCTSIPELQVPSPAVEGEPFDVGMNILALPWQVGAKVAVTGQNITVDVSTFYEGPGDKLPDCQTYKTTISALPAGEYTLTWRYTPWASLPTAMTSHVTVVKPARRRSTHH